MDLSILSEGTQAEAPTLSEPQFDEAYSDYLDLVLSDYGIQFSPGGSSVIEVEEGPSPAHVEEETSSKEEKPLNLKTKRAESRDTIHRPESCSPESDGVLTIDESNEAAQEQIPVTEKMKLYQKGPLHDPEMERKRLNAVLAKKNRDMKKMEIIELKRQLSKLRHVNSQCNKVLKRTNIDILRLSQELRTARAASSRLTDAVRNKERENQVLSKELMLFLGHLDIISASLDEDNPTRKQLLALAKRFSCGRVTV